MTSTTAPAALAFELYVPARGAGLTHLHADDTIGILCRSAARYSTFTVAGIVPAGTATCTECNRIGQALAITATAKAGGPNLVREF